MDLKDRVALVAGGTGLLGTAIARALAGAGADIAITYLERTDAARETTAAVEALGRRAWSVALDQTKAEAIPAAVEAVAKHCRVSAAAALGEHVAARTDARRARAAL